ncbi:MAG: T9SS type A sorting domain-containing protein [Bacteroidota bacterium]
MRNEFFQNYPNPFNPTTTISYQLATPSHLTLKVFNMLGQEVATLVYGQQLAGFHQATWSTSGFASGVYVYRLTAGQLRQASKFSEVDASTQIALILSVRTSLHPPFRAYQNETPPILAMDVVGDE